jgi:hypothetical protein
MRTGGALSLADASDGRLGVVTRAFRSAALTGKVQEALGSQVSVVPRTDPNQLSALLYEAPGDGIDWHVDSNAYMGARWAGLYTVEDDGDAVLEVDGEEVRMQPNEMVLFRADLIRHRLRRRSTHGSRLVVNVLYCDVCTFRNSLVSKVWNRVVSGVFF